MCRRSAHRSSYGVTVDGSALPGANEGDDARAFSGIFPASGAYLLVVGTSRGGGSYRLNVRIDAQ